MAVTEKDIIDIQNIISPLLGKRVWGADLGFGSFVTLEFGTPLAIEKSPKRPRGEWHLWVMYCAWRLESRTEVMAGSEDPRFKLKEAVRQMDGLALRSVTITAPALETSLTFDEGVVLHLFPIYTAEFEHWLLFDPTGKVLSIGPNMTWSYESSNKPPRRN
jgi:hypothetical protein